MIELTIIQRAELERLNASSRLDLLTGKRVMAMLHLDRGKTVKQVSDAVLVSEQTIYKWIELFNKGDDSGNSVKGLFIKQYKIRDGDLIPEQQKRLIEHFSNHIAQNIQEVIEYIRVNFDEEYSRSGAIKLMNRLGFTFKKPKQIGLVASVDCQKQYIEQYEELRDSLPENEVIVFGDAVHPTHQSKPSGGWIYGDDKVAIKANSGRQRINILGALNIRDGKFNLIADEKINAQSVIKIIKNLEAIYPDKQTIHYFVDNARYFHANMVKEYQKNNKTRVKFHFLPPYCPHLNPIERLWGVMHKKITHNRYYEKFDNFSKSVLHFLRQTINQNWLDFNHSITDNFRIISHANFKFIQ